MNIEEDKVPPRAYTHQSETVNSMLSAKKTALGFSKKDDVGKTVFIKDIWCAVVAHQDYEIEKAIIKQSNEYHLAQSMEYLTVELETWTCWSKEERVQYVRQFREMTSDEVKQRKEIDTDCFGMCFGETETIDVLSVKLSEKLPNLLHCDLIERKALQLLNIPNAVVLEPTLIPQINGKIYLVAGKDIGNGPSKVRITGLQHRVHCSCKGFRFSNICAHSVAVAYKEDILATFVARVKQSRGSRSILTFPENAGGAGRKGKQNRRTRSYPVSSTQDQVAASQEMPFTEIWHNNNPIVVCSIDAVPVTKNRCTYYGNEFPQGPFAIVPFDIVLKHEERWRYLNRNRQRPSDPTYLPSSAKKLTTKYYCVRRNCVYMRFPYFCAGILLVDPECVLNESHKKVVKEQLSITL